MTTSDAIAALVAPVLEAGGASLYDVEVTGATVRVLVDGASMEVLERVSPDVSAVLDETDDMPERWFLEVSSPGLERPLRRPEHFQGAIGTKVKVKTRGSVEGDRRIEGELAEADAADTPNGGIVVAGRRVAYGEIEKARTVFEWPGQDKPGSAKSTKQRSKP
jgi:ribosome maturation factor RimP